MQILKLDKAGNPRDWISREDAACMYAKGLVLWELGEKPTIMTGGIGRSGIQTTLDIAPIIAVSGEMQPLPGTFSLTNKALFRRDNNQCMYCGQHFSASKLTRDHIIPRVQGGQDIWTNVITSCARCNHAKGGRTPEEAGLELLAVPFAPNLFEYMYLRNHKIVADQMQFLSNKFSGKRMWQ